MGQSWHLLNFMHHSIPQVDASAGLIAGASVGGLWICIHKKTPNPTTLLLMIAEPFS